jgi:ribosomal protein S18
MENKYKNSKQKKANSFADKNGNKQTRSRVLSLAQLLSRVRKQRGLTNLTQSNSNIQLSGMSNTQTRNSGVQKNVGGNSISPFGEVKGKGRSFSFGNENLQRNKMFSFPSGKSGAKNAILPFGRGSQKEEQKNQKPIKPIIPPKSLVIILREKPEKILYNRRIIDYKHCGLLQRYIGLGGKILPRRQTRLTAKQQRYIAKTIKSARIMGLLPFVSKEKGFFR